MSEKMNGIDGHFVFLERMLVLGGLHTGSQQGFAFDRGFGFFANLSRARGGDLWQFNHWLAEKHIAFGGHV